MTTHHDDRSVDRFAHAPLPDELDARLRRWHEANRARALAGRDQLMARLASERVSAPAAQPSRLRVTSRARSEQAPPPPTRPLVISAFRRFGVWAFARLAASLAILAVLAVWLVPTPRSSALAHVILVPDAGRLDAFDEQGNLLGPCPLKHTDVNVDISAFFSRVALKQTYHNTNKDKIEAVYTFPLSHRGAVDRMTMTIRPPEGNERVVVGEVKERELARQIYEAAREQGYVAALLEQERPNIFTQSVANIEPGAQVVVEISYVETLESKDGEYRFDFPMVVGPRYTPGYATQESLARAPMPGGLHARRGVTLLGPATMVVGEAGDVSKLGTLQPAKLAMLLAAARAIEVPAVEWWAREVVDKVTSEPREAPPLERLQWTVPPIWHQFQVAYWDGSREVGTIRTDGSGQINGRWFFIEPRMVQEILKSPGVGTGYEPNTNQVPDASRISPMPVKPPTRAGHDISLTVNIDTGGPRILDVKSELHEVQDTGGAKYGNLGNRRSFALKNDGEIPNRDFMLSWRTDAASIQEAQFAHTDPRGNFFTLILNPPARVEEAAIRGRELVFVMDTSGSMRGFPIEKSKEVMRKAIDSMRGRDTFNVITFSGSTAILWDEPKPATEENKAAAQAFVAGQSGRGGTEMMKAIEAALVQKPGDAGPQPLTPRQLANLPADGREVVMRVSLREVTMLLQDGPQPGMFDIPIDHDNSIRVQARSWHLAKPISIDPRDPPDMVIDLHGRWETINGRRVLVGRATDPLDVVAPMRLALFFTDGFVGNDMPIIDAVKRNAATTRVFSFGIGNSVNRYLLDSMAQAGRGEVEYVSLQGDADASVERLVKRIDKPVLTDIKLSFSPSPESGGVEILETIPPLDAVPDLFDVRPLIIHGRYAKPQAAPGAPGVAGNAGRGTLTITGNTGAGRYERKLDIELPAERAEHDVIATLWGRAKVEQVMWRNLAAVQQGNPPEEMRKEIIALGEQFGLVTQFTSFVAVEKSRMTIGGRPMLVAVPIELPAGAAWEGFFGGEANDEEVIRLGMDLGRLNVNLKDDSEELARVDQAEADPALVARVRAQGVQATLKEVRHLQLEMRYADALRRIKAILAVDELNPAALALQDVLRSQATYLSWSRDERHKEFGVSAMTLEGVPRQPQAEPKIIAGGRVPLLGDIPMLQDAWVRSGGPPPEGFRVRLDSLIAGNSSQAKGVDGQSPAGSPKKIELPRLRESAGTPSTSAYGLVRERDPSQLGFGVAVGSDAGFFGDISQHRGRVSGLAPTGLPPAIHSAGGRGLVDRISEHQRLLAAPTGSEREGKFGWKAGPGSVLTFKGGPTLNELGLTNDLAGESRGGAGERFVPLKHADAGHVSQLLNALMAESGSGMQGIRTPDHAQDSLGRRAVGSTVGPPLTVTPVDGTNAVRVDAPPEIADAVAAVIAEHFDQQAPTWRPVTLVILDIAKLVRADKLEDATKLAAEVIAAAPNFDLGVKMRDALADATLDHAQKGAKATEIAAEAWRRIVAAMIRANIRQVIDERLLPLLNEAMNSKTSADGALGVAASAGVEAKDGRVLVTILVGNVNDQTKRALTEAGVRIEDATAAGASPAMVVGWVALGDLVTVALMDGVRRVEPTQAR